MKKKTRKRFKIKYQNIINFKHHLKHEETVSFVQFFSKNIYSRETVSICQSAYLEGNAV